MANEKRLIDANELLDFVKELKFHGGTKTRTQAGQEVLDIHIPHIVAKIPTVDAVEVVHGRWIPNFEYDFDRGEHRLTGYHCDKCGIWTLHKSNYCPNCGADMRGETE